MTAQRMGSIGCAASLVLGLSLSGCADSTMADSPGGTDPVLEAVLAVSALHEPRFLPDSKPKLSIVGTGVAATLADTRLFPGRRCYVVPRAVLRLEPVDDGLRIVGLDLPDTMSLTSADVRADATLRLASYELVGQWSESGGRLASVNEAVTGLRLDYGISSLTIGSIRSSIRVVQTEAGSWQEQGTLEVRDYRYAGLASEEFSRLYVRWTSASIEPAKLLELTMWDSCTGGAAGIPDTYRRSLRHLGITTPFQGEIRIEGVASAGDYVPVTVRTPDATITVTTQAGTRTPSQWQLQFMDDSGDARRSAMAVLGCLDGLLYSLAGFAPAQLSFQFPEFWEARGKVDTLYDLESHGSPTPVGREFDIRMGDDGIVTVNGGAIPPDAAN